MNLVIFGVQGSGKGTQAERIASVFHVHHISPGELFREEVRKGTAMGKQIESYMDKGVLVPKDINFAVVKQALQDVHFEHFILDGFPRNYEQAVFLDKLVKLDAVIEIVISDKEALQRISSRRICKQCGAGYNIISILPKQEGVCDHCQGQLITRDDDKPDAVKKRIQIYHADTEPLKGFYSKKGILIEINGEQPIDAVFQDIQQRLGK